LSGRRCWQEFGIESMLLSAARVVYERCVVRRCVGVQLCGVVCGLCTGGVLRCRSDKAHNLYHEISSFSFPPIPPPPPTPPPHTYTHLEPPTPRNSFTNAAAHRFAWSTICA
jgi:hypothetical protein